MQGYLEAVGAETRILLVLSIILFAGFIMTRLTNTLNLPKVSGYILAGILIGPCGLDMIPADMIENLSFVSDLALAFIAFGVGKFFKKEVIKEMLIVCSGSEDCALIQFKGNFKESDIDALVQQAENQRKE